MMKQSVIFRDLGQMDYKSAWDYQESLLSENVRRKSLVYSQESIVNENFLTTENSELETHNSELRTHNSELRTQNSELRTQNYLLFVEHPPVFTLGKSGNLNNILLSEERL